MNELLNMLEDFYQIANIKELLIAFLIALPIGWNREKESRSMGLRTFPLVALASCGYMLIGNVLVDGNPDAIARLLTGLMTGIGFIGGGAIIKDKGGVHGTATAASIWSTGTIGASVAFHHYEIAITLSLINFAILALAKPVKKTIKT